MRYDHWEIANFKSKIIKLGKKWKLLNSYFRHGPFSAFPGHADIPIKKRQTHLTNLLYIFNY